jgi:hypothetical protein
LSWAGSRVGQASQRVGRALSYEGLCMLKQLGFQTEFTLL